MIHLQLNSDTNRYFISVVCGIINETVHNITFVVIIIPETTRQLLIQIEIALTLIVLSALNIYI